MTLSLSKHSNMETHGEHYTHCGFGKSSEGLKVVCDLAAPESHLPQEYAIIRARFACLVSVYLKCKQFQ